MIIIQPGDDPQSLGQVKSGLTGEVFTSINSDVSKECEKDNKDEDLDWCSLYLAIRFVVLVKGLAALISPSM